MNAISCVCAESAIHLFNQFFFCRCSSWVCQCRRMFQCINVLFYHLAPFIYILFKYLNFMDSFHYDYCSYNHFTHNHRCQHSTLYCFQRKNQMRVRRRMSRIVAECEHSVNVQLSRFNIGWHGWHSTIVSVNLFEIWIESDSTSDRNSTQHSTAGKPPPKLLFNIITFDSSVRRLPPSEIHYHFRCSACSVVMQFIHAFLRLPAPNEYAQKPSHLRVAMNFGSFSLESRTLENSHRFGCLLHTAATSPSAQNNNMKGAGI